MANCSKDDVAAEATGSKGGGHEAKGDGAVEDGVGVDGDDECFDRPNDEVDEEEVGNEGKEHFVAADQRPGLGEGAAKWQSRLLAPRGAGNGSRECGCHDEDGESEGSDIEPENVGRADPGDEEAGSRGSDECTG